MRVSTAILLSGCLLTAAPHASADTLVVTETATGSGIVYSPHGQSVNFSNVSVLHTYTGDTSATTVTSAGSSNFGGSESITIGGFGTETFFSTPPLFNPPNGGFDYGVVLGATNASILAVSQIGDPTREAGYTTSDPSFAEYTFASSFGPVNGTFTYFIGPTLPSPPDEYQIGSEVIDINSYSPTSTFQSSIISTTPEPSTLVLLGTGLLSTVGVVRRRYLQH